MCGRFTLTGPSLAQLALGLDAELAEGCAEAYRARYNVAPGNDHFLLRRHQGKRRVFSARWGLLNSWSKQPSVAFKQINARAETVHERPAYRDAFRSRRAVVLADGFYEWHGPRGERTPMWFHGAEGQLLLLAGLFEQVRQGSEGRLLTTFTIITTEANEVVIPFHGRMPAIIEASRLDDWLEGPTPRLCLAPLAAGRLQVRAASRRLNTASNDDPSCLEPDPAQSTQAQLRLF